MEARFRSLPCTRPKVRPEQLEEYIRGEIARWREVRKVARAVCDGMPTDPRMAALGSKLIQLYDGNNISFLLQRYPGDPARAVPPFPEHALPRLVLRRGTMRPGAPWASSTTSRTWSA